MNRRTNTPGEILRADSAGGRRAWLVPGLLVLLTAAAFLPTFRNGFVTYDDPGYVYENPHVRSGLTPETVAWSFTTFQQSNWHPLTWISHALDVTLFGVSPSAHHGMSLFLHILAVVVLYAAFERMTGDRWKSAFVALVFGIHPLHVESVAWVSERKDVLSGLFMALTLHAYAGYAASGRRAEYLRAVGMFALGLLAKPMLVSVPFVLLLLDYWPLGRIAGGLPGVASAARRAEPLRKLLLEKAPFLLLAAASSAVTYAAQEWGGAVAEGGALRFGERAANAVTSYAGYVTRAFAPVDLAFFYPHRMDAIPAAEIALSAAGLIAVSVAAWRARKTRPYLFTGWALFLGMLVPVIGLVQVGLQAMADRYMYLPITGLAIVVAWGLPALVRPAWAGKFFLGTAFALVAVAMGALTWNQVGVWRDSMTLYGHALAVTEGNHIAHTNIGVALADQGRDAEAIPHFKEALRLWPRNFKNFSNLARSLAAVGRYSEALPYYREIIRNVQPNPLLHLRIGDVFAGLGEPDSAIAHYELAVGIDSTMVEAQMGIADIASSRSEFDRARESLRKVFALQPGNSRAHDMLGIVAGRQNLPQEAEEEFRRAIAADSMNEQACVDLGILYEKTGRQELSRGMYETAVRLNPRSVAAGVRLGIAMARGGDLAGAEREWLRCVEMAPPAVEARMNLARLYTMQGKVPAAIGHYEAVIAADPSRADARFLLGRLLGGKGDVEGAKRRYREALRLDPGLSGAAEALRLLESAGR